MVSAKSATLPERATTTSCTQAVMSKPTHDHLMAHRPRAVVTIAGSTTP
jgi:hypothetical protein